MSFTKVQSINQYEKFLKTSKTSFAAGD